MDFQREVTFPVTCGEPVEYLVVPNSGAARYVWEPCGACVEKAISDWFAVCPEPVPAVALKR